MKTDVLTNSLEFLYTFMRAHYTRAELAVLLDTSQAVLSGKISQNRWMLSEIVKVIENKGYRFYFALGYNSSYLMSAFIESFGHEEFWGNDTNAIRYFIKHHAIPSHFLSDVGMSSILQRAFKGGKNDIKWASLMKFVLQSDCDIYIKIQKDEMPKEDSQERIVPKIDLEDPTTWGRRKSRQLVSVNTNYMVELQDS